LLKEHNSLKMQVPRKAIMEGTKLHTWVLAYLKIIYYDRHYVQTPDFVCNRYIMLKASSSFPGISKNHTFNNFLINIDM
jgi:hypothetical protein